MALRGFGATAPGFLEVIERTAYGPTATTYTPNPVLNPATHRMLNSMYVPDRVASRAHVHSTEPFFLSLTQAEQNRFWAKELFGGEEEEGDENQKTSQSSMIVGTKKQALPLNSWARLLTNNGSHHGSRPQLKTVRSEPSILRYSELDPHVTGSTMTFEKQRGFRRTKLAEKGKNLLWSAIDKSSASNKSNVAVLMAVVKQEKKLRDMPLKQKALRTKGWGVGEKVAATSLDHFKSTGFEGSCKW